VNPMILKKRLAHEIVTQFHDQKAAQEAETRFESEVQRRERPKEVHIKKEVYIKDKIVIKDEVSYVLRRDIAKWLHNEQLAKSLSEAKRLIAQGAVEVIHEDGTKTIVRDEMVEIKPGDVIKVGAGRFMRMVGADK
jgi:tyrosyl-tRNA synthetase